MIEIFPDNRSDDEIIEACNRRLDEIQFIGADNSGTRVSYDTLPEKEVQEGVNFLLNLIFEKSIAA